MPEEREQPSAEETTFQGPELTERAREQLERFRTAHETQVLTILLSDLEGSTRQQNQLGNVRAADLVRTHRAIFRRTLGGFDGEEVETAGDSFLVVFAAPSEGVKFALHMQSGMRDAHRQTPDLPAVRVGIHQGQVVVERHADGGKAMDIYGLQVSTAARIMDLAQGGQILCSRAVFDDARTILRGEDLQGLGAVAWCNHGPYRFKGVEDNYDVCEVGEEGAAPMQAPPAGAKSWPAGQAEEELGWRPATGVSVPQSDWILEERLGKEESDPAGGARYRGVFGEVWKAWNPTDKSYEVFKFCFKRDRVPALKREARLLKRLRKHRHPNLVEVFDITEGDRPPYYLEMEYVPGPSMEEWLATDPPLTERLEIIAQVADALDTVHAAGIYHRDIKPANILLTHRQDGTLQAKLSDFGLGAADDRELLQSIYVSRVEGVAGTWDYLAPELRNGGSASSQSDLYSLGITLYQLVVGDARRPLTADWEGQVPSEVLRNDIRRCVVAGPADRWKRPAELATALRSHDERLERLRLQREREAQRRRTKRLSVISAVAGLFAAVMIGFGGYAWHQRGVARTQALEADRQRQVAQHERDNAVAARQTAEERLYRSNILLADSQIAKQRHDLARASLWGAPARLHDWEWGYLLRVSHIELATLTGHWGDILTADFSPDGGRIVTAGVDGTIRVWDAATGAELRMLHRPAKNLQRPTKEVYGAAFDPSGARVVAALADGKAVVWNATTGEVLATLSGHDGKVHYAAFSRDGSRIVTASGDGTAKVWDPAAPARPITLSGHKKRVHFASFSPDGKRVVTISDDGTARVWDAATRKVSAELTQPNHNITGAAFSPDSRTVVTASEGNTAMMWDAATGAKLRPLSGHQQMLYSAVFSGDGRRIVTASADGTARIWDAATGHCLLRLPSAGGKVRSAAFSPDDARVVTASDNRTATVWDAATGAVLVRLCGHEGKVTFATFSADGARVLTVSGDETVKVWDLVTGPASTKLTGHDKDIRWASFSRDGRRIVTASLDQTAMIWDAATGTKLFCLRGHEDAVTSASFSPDGTRVVTASDDGTARLWDARTGGLLHTLPKHRAPEHKAWVFAASFSPDGTRVLTASSDQAARIWEAATGKLLQTLRVPRDTAAPFPARPAVPGILKLPSDPKPTTQPRAGESRPGGERKWPFFAAFSPDGERVVTAAVAVKIWNARTGAELIKLTEHRADVRSAAFSPDGSRIVTASIDATAKVWDARTGKALQTLRGHRFSLLSAVFDPAGARVVTASADGTAMVWDATTGTRLATLAGHENAVIFAAFSPNGRRIFTASDGGTAKIWDAASGAELTTLAGRARTLLATGFSPDGLRIAIVSRDGTARVWCAAPFRRDALPGDASMAWAQRFRLWQARQHQAWLARQGK